MRAHRKVTDWQATQTSTTPEPKAKRSIIPEPAFILKSLYLNWRFAEEGPTHWMRISFKYKKLPCKNLNVSDYSCCDRKKK